MAMKNPPHPGRLVRDACLEPLGLNVTEAAKVLGAARTRPVFTPPRSDYCAT